MNAFKFLFAATALVTVFASGAWAQGFPSRPVKLVVPYAAGGAVDVLARLFAQELTGVLGQSVVVENKPGASTAVGAAAVAQSPADGYTILAGTASTMSINPGLYSKLPYQPSQLEPVALMGKMPLVVLAGPGVPKTLQELRAFAKANPGKLNYGTPGQGTLGHLMGEKFKSATGIDITAVAYKGNSQALIDLKAGRLELLFDGLSSALPQIQAGGLHAIAVISDKRSAAAPNIPTLAEQGTPSLTSTFWVGLFAPAGTPADVLNVLNAAIRKVSNAPALAKRMQQDGVDPAQLTAPEFKQMVAKDQDDWKSTLAPMNLKLD